MTKEVKQLWIGLVILFIIVSAGFFIIGNQLTNYGTVINNQGMAITEIVNFLQNPAGGTPPQEPVVTEPFTEPIDQATTSKSI